MRLTSAVLALAVAAPVAGAAHEGGEKPEYTITVSGEAVVAAVPDKAIITLAVQGKPAKKRREAEENQSVLAKGLMDALRAAGIAERDIKSQYRGMQDYYEQEGQKSVKKGYFVNQVFQVRLSREKVSAILDAVPDFASEQSTGYYVSNARALRDEATNAAIDDAKARAKTRAERLGITLGPILAYVEGGLGRPQPQTKGLSRMSAGMADESAAPEVPAGEEELHVSVTVTYRINVP